MTKLYLLYTFLFLSLLVIACQNTTPANPITEASTFSPTTTTTPQLATPNPSITFTTIPSITTTSTPTSTSQPTQTPTPTSHGVLTWKQEEKLYQVSIKFLAETEEDSFKVVHQQIDYLPGNNEDPSLVCGPLSAIILRDAGILPPDTNIHDFWLLNPRTKPNQITLEKYFPTSHYAWYHFDTATNEFDFNTFPLLPGDFLYLYAGNNGSFEHIITITRVDEKGRAYTVSNLQVNDPDTNQNFFVIRELMLYDPTQPNVGQFYDWTNYELNKYLGRTGYGGFDLWRPIVPIPESQEFTDSE